MDRLDLYSDFAVVGTIRHLTNSEEGRSVSYNELIGKLTKLFGNKVRARNALERAKEGQYVVTDNNRYSLSTHVGEIIDGLSSSWKRNILPRIG